MPSSASSISVKWDDNPGWLETITRSTSHLFEVGFTRNWEIKQRERSTPSSNQRQFTPGQPIRSSWREKKTSTEGRRTGGHTRTHDRNSSYGMNCDICHRTKITGFLEPTSTTLYMEGKLRPKDYSGQAGPAFASPRQNKTILAPNRYPNRRCSPPVLSESRTARGSTGSLDRVGLSTRDQSFSRLG